MSLRFFNVYGPRARTCGTYGAVFGVFLAQLLAGKPLTIVGDGEQTRDFTFVSDVVDAFVTVAQTATKPARSTMSAAASRSASTSWCGCSARRATVHIPKRPGEPDCTWADIGKIGRRTRLGAESRVSPTGCKIMRENIDYWRDAPVWTADRHRRGHERLVSISGLGPGENRGIDMESSALKFVRPSPSALPVAKTPRDKIRTVDELAAIVARAAAGPARSVVQAHGTFDLLHLGHVRHLEAARRHRRRAGRHGHRRPLRQQGPRPAGLHRGVCARRCWPRWNTSTGWRSTTRPTPSTRIERIRPNIYVKGQDYQNPEGDITGKITHRARGGRRPAAAASSSPTR